MTTTVEMTAIETPAKSKRARKAPRRKRTAPPAPKVPKDSLMAGITVSDCPSGCSATRCVISGVGICSHPHKGGLQAGLQNNDSMRRLNEAKRILGKAKLDLLQGT